MIEANERLFARLRALAAAAVPFVTIGSAGLLLAHPRLRAEYALPDADVLLAPRHLRRFVRWAEREGGAVTSWGEPWRWSWRARDLAGRHYVRATWGAEQLDATYEVPAVDVAAAVRDARWIDGVPVDAERALWAGKRRKDEVAARAFAARFGLAVEG